MKHGTLVSSTITISAVLCVAVLLICYVSIFRGGYVSHTTADQTTFRIGIQQVGAVHLQRGTNLPGLDVGWRTGLGRPYIKTFGFPGFAFESRTGSTSYTLLRVPLWFLMLATGILPAARLWRHRSSRRLSDQACPA